jgi:chromosomal replication initiation ATPase DnaA
MSLVEQFHAAHKARLSRLGAVAPTPSVLAGGEQELRAEVKRQNALIRDLSAIVSRQRIIIRKFADESEFPTPRIADVIAVVAEHFNFTRQMLIGAQRTYDIAHARQVGYYLCRELGFAWLPIGRGFGKDHSSALHGTNKIAQMVAADPALALEIEAIKTAIDKYVANRIKTAKAAL